MRGTLPFAAIGFFCGAIGAGSLAPARAGSLEDRVEVVLLAISYQKLNSSDYVIAIVHDQGVSERSLGKVDRAMRRSRSLSRKGIKLSTIIVPISESESLGRRLKEVKANAVYIMADTRLENVKTVVNLTRELKLLSISGSSKNVDQAGVTLSVEKTGRGYKILINHQGRAQEGVVFDTRLLRMSSR